MQNKTTDHKFHKNKLYPGLALAMILLLMTGCGQSAVNSTEQETSEPAIHVEEIPDEDQNSGEMAENPDEDTDGGEADSMEDKGSLYYDVQKGTADMNYTGQASSAFMQPILQNPTADTVTVQWFTEEEGTVNEVYLYEDLNYTDEETTDSALRESIGNKSAESSSLTSKAETSDGAAANAETSDVATANAETSDGAASNIMISDGIGMPTRTIAATTTVMSRLRGGKTDSDLNDPTIHTTIYKHTAVIDNLPEYHGYVSERINYRIATDDEQSAIYSLAAAPTEGTPMRILLTSDLQIKNMCAANYQKVYETIGNVDAIWCDGDLVDVTDRVYDWFYADNAFWRVLTGTACDEIGESVSQTYYGAPLVQNAPIYTAIGNHDVMGVYDETTDLSVQFNNPSTLENAENEWEKYVSGLDDGDSLTQEDHDEYVRDHSFNTITYEEMFELPTSERGGEKYYSVSLGDVRLITLDLTRIWRLTALGGLGKYSEVPGGDEEDYGFGEFIFEPITEGSDQLSFLKSELAKDEYQSAKYKVVMFHSEAHSLGDNQSPAFTDPVASEVTDPVTGKNMTVYDYPLAKDYINTIVEPLLTANGTNLLFEAHSHLWNRFKTESGMNVLETSNVGNSYGAYTGDSIRDTVPPVITGDQTYASISDTWDANDYPVSGDPYGLDPIAPNVSALPDDEPYLSSNTITAFSILDTGKGTVDSYYFDTEDPDAGVVLFDSFKICSEN